MSSNILRTRLLLIALLISGCGQKQTNTLSINYEKYELDNGLTVILHEDNSDPIVGVAIVYHVGSNREEPGRTGFAHLFEHMLFQESQHVGQDQFFKKIQNAGGTLNGGTSNDYTIYYEVVPNNALETVLWMESDRMGWLLSTVTQPAFENQQEVVQNEKRQRVDNRPYGHSNYVTIKNMYPEGHPYSWTVIGELEDLQNATLEDVRSFYEQWYGPNNATMVIAGDISPRAVKKMVEKYFGEIKKGLIATGDKFISDCDKETLSEKFPYLLAVEMEGAAFAQVACQEGIPWLVIRTISDNANGLAAQDFTDFLYEYKFESNKLLNILIKNHLNAPWENKRS